MTLEELQAGKVFLVDKPLDWTSFQAINALRYGLCHHFGIKKLKIGHAGTLDPKATGLLIVCAGRSTKSIENYQAQQKQYIATIKLGAITPSYDTEHQEDAWFETKHITLEKINEALNHFVGGYVQKPPLFSAIKQKGKRLYEIARAGGSTHIVGREVFIDQIKILDFKMPYLTIVIDCGKGTYIRSLADDLGKLLQSGAYLTALKRTSIGSYNVKDAKTPREIIDALKEA